MLKVQRPSRQKERLLRQVTDTDTPKKRLNAVVEAGLYKRIKLRAAQEDRTISDITRTLWVEYLSK